MNPLETYLTELREIHDSGAATKETSGYNALANLLNTIGHSLKPKVRCIIQLKNSGAGFPDGGLFTSDQLITDSGIKKFHLLDIEPPVKPDPDGRYPAAMQGKAEYEKWLIEPS